ncbi:unnamed protein product [Cuscuta europaea]|uniref:Uncharacterized protein n=1 Tax=Cuscuta europaea TaxID=41803 RepID=A0A9P1EAL6_CUSEU|nr:unnamed protein product [Cuscuta europaea]
MFRLTMWPPLGLSLLRENLKVEPMRLLADMDNQIIGAKEEVLSRKEYWIRLRNGCSFAKKRAGLRTVIGSITSAFHIRRVTSQVDMMDQNDGYSEMMNLGGSKPEQQGMYVKIGNLLRL